MDQNNTAPYFLSRPAQQYPEGAYKKYMSIKDAQRMLLFKFKVYNHVGMSENCLYQILVLSI